jgi:hypothetical protein
MNKSRHTLESFVESRLDIESCHDGFCDICLQTFGQAKACHHE